MDPAVNLPLGACIYDLDGKLTPGRLTCTCVKWMRTFVEIELGVVRSL
jgi:hypothetical protein